MTNQELLSLLRALEFSGKYTPAGRECPTCRQSFSKYGHEDDCELDKAIQYFKYLIENHWLVANFC